MANYISPATVLRVNGKNFTTAITMTVQSSLITSVEAYTPATQSTALGAPKIIVPAAVQSVITLAGTSNTVPTKVYTSSTAAAIVTLINA
jgi:hypothetical protein